MRIVFSFGRPIPAKLDRVVQGYSIASYSILRSESDRSMVESIVPGRFDRFNRSEARFRDLIKIRVLFLLIVKIITF